MQKNDHFKKLNQIKDSCREIIANINNRKTIKINPFKINNISHNSNRLLINNKKNRKLLNKSSIKKLKNNKNIVHKKQNIVLEKNKNKKKKKI